jgi:hypothetical protein
MSDEDFLARWSRRKQEAKAGPVELKPEEPAEANRPARPEHPAAQPGTPEVDLSRLPAIESIDAVTDITGFLRTGIPQELSRAALRRAWSADPAIRDFVGPAENAWNFNDPNAMPGFGPIDYSAEQLDSLVRRIVGGVAQAAETVPDPVAEAADREQPAGAVAVVAQASNLTEGIAAARPGGETTPAEPGSAASQPKIAPASESEEVPVRRRTHGGALPR